MARTHSDGSLPSLRTGTNPAPMRSATAAPRMNPRLSIPTTSVIPGRRSGAAMLVDGEAKPLGVAQQRGDVVEEDAGLREVRNVADLGFEISH